MDWLIQSSFFTSEGIIAWFLPFITVVNISQELESIMCHHIINYSASSCTLFMSVLWWWWMMINVKFFNLGVRGLCKSWKETETQLEGDVYWSLWWDSNRSEETNGGDGETRKPIQRSIPSEELCEVAFFTLINSRIWRLRVLFKW